MANIFQMAVGAVRGMFTKVPGAEEYFANAGNWKTVTSSNLRSVSYFLSVTKGKESALGIRFKDGSQYEYSGVPLSVFHNLMAASSKGKFAHRNIYWNYPMKRVR